MVKVTDIQSFRREQKNETVCRIECSVSAAEELTTLRMNYEMRIRSVLLKMTTNWNLIYILEEQHIYIQKLINLPEIDLNHRRQQ